MVREHEVDAAAMDVEALAEMLPCHRGAFDVPAGTALGDDARRRRPGRLAGFGRLPQHEVGDVALVGRDIDSGAGDHLVERALCQRAVARQHRVRGVHRLRREQHMVFGNVGEAAGDELLDDRPHLRNVFGRARLHRRRQATERGHVVLILLIGLLGDLADRLVQRQAGKVARGARVDLVVDVGDVADIRHVLGAVVMAQHAEQQVEHDRGAAVADMGEVVDRRPAGIHADVGGIERHEGPLFPGERIVEAQLHRHPSGGGRASNNLE